MADFDFFKRSDGYLQEDGFFKASANEILYWPKEDDVGFVLNKKQAEEAAASLSSVTKAWRGKFWAAYTVLATVIAGFLSYLFYQNGLPDHDQPVLLAFFIVLFFLIAAFIPLRFVFGLIRKWRVWRLRDRFFNDLASSSDRRVEQDMPDPILLRPSVTGGYKYPLAIHQLRLLGGFLLFVLTVLCFFGLLATDDSIKLGLFAVGLVLMMSLAWNVAVPELRAVSPKPRRRKRKKQKRRQTESERRKNAIRKSDVRAFIEWFVEDFKKGPKHGFASTVMIVCAFAICFVIYLRIDSLDLPSFGGQSANRFDVSAEYCKLLAGRQCIAVPDDLVIERWETAPAVIFDYGSSIDQGSAEQWAEEIMEQLVRSFDLAGFGKSVRRADALPTDGTPYIAIRFDNKEVPDSVEGIVAGTQDVENGVFLSAQYAFNLPALEALLNQSAGPGANWINLQNERETIARHYAIQTLGLDPNWQPLQRTRSIAGESVDLTSVMYRIHHNPRLIAGQTFQTQRDALDAIVNEIFRYPDAWTD